MLSIIKEIMQNTVCQYGKLKGSDVLVSASDNEYECIRNKFGYCPLSFQKFISVSIDSEEILDSLVTKDVVFLNSGDNKQSYILSEEGTIDAVVSIYKNDDNILIECAEWNLEKVKEVFDSAGCVYHDVDMYCVLMEGPECVGAFENLLEISLEYMSFQNHEYFQYEGNDLLIARIGYTGEFGYKIIADKKTIEIVLRQFVEKDADKLVGTDVFKKCFIEVKQQDWALSYLNYSDNIFELDYQWLIDFKKDTEYRGRNAIFEKVSKNITKNTIGALCEEKVKVGSEVEVDGQTIGLVIDVQYSDTLKKYICMLLVECQYANAGFDYVADGFSMHTVSAPYIVPKSWTVGKEEN